MEKYMETGERGRNAAAYKHVRIDSRNRPEDREVDTQVAGYRQEYE
jgi:hypothetical protein